MLSSSIKETYSPPVFFFFAPGRKTADRCVSSSPRESHFFTHCSSFVWVDIFDSLARTDPQVRELARAIFHLAGRISRSASRSESRKRALISFSKDTYGKSLRIQRRNDVNISRISGGALERKCSSVTIAFNFTDSFIPSRNPFRGTRHSLARDHNDYVTAHVDDTEMTEPSMLEEPSFIVFLQRMIIMSGCMSSGCEISK